MGVYGRARMKASPQYRLQVAEAALKAIDAALDKIHGDAGGEPVDEIFNAMGWWKAGLILKTRLP